MNEAMMIELFGGTNRYKVLRKLYERPTERHHLRALAALTGISSGTLHTTLKRLERAGLVRRIAGKPLVFYQAPVDDSRLAPLLDLFRRESDLVTDLRAALEPFTRQVTYAGLFGSSPRDAADRREAVPERGRAAVARADRRVRRVDGADGSAQAARTRPQGAAGFGANAGRSGFPVLREAGPLTPYIVCAPGATAPLTGIVRQIYLTIHSYDIIPIEVPSDSLL